MHNLAVMMDCGVNKRGYRIEEFLWYVPSKRCSTPIINKCHRLKSIPLGMEMIADQIEFHHINVDEPNTSITIDAMRYMWKNMRWIFGMLDNQVFSILCSRYIEICFCSFDIIEYDTALVV